MAKELPYFKFNVSEWTSGDITLCSLQAQGLFINLCASYWNHEGNLSLEKCKRRFVCSDEIWEELKKEGTIKVSGDVITINFLDEQFQERKVLSKANSNNAKKRWGKEQGEEMANTFLSNVGVGQSELITRLKAGWKTLGAKELTDLLWRFWSEERAREISAIIATSRIKQEQAEVICKHFIMMQIGAGIEDKTPKDLLDHFSKWAKKNGQDIAKEWTDKGINGFEKYRRPGK